MSTVDPNKTNIRATTFKVRRLLRWWGGGCRADTIFLLCLQFQVTNLQICLLATNVKHPGEQPQTISVVVHVVSPGAPSYKPILEDGVEPNNVKCEVNAGRAKNPEEGPRQLFLLKMIALSRMFTGVVVALPHRSGMFPFHVSGPSSSCLDWMYMMLEAHVMCIFNVRVSESIGRMKVRHCLVHLALAWLP
jgi:hypothetical protein